MLGLGGLGRIGMNNMVVRIGERRWLVDCGVRFPGTRERFVDVVLPDLGWIRRHAQSFQGLILTHGHEDHVGAIPYVVEALRDGGLESVPIYGSGFTLGLVRKRLSQHKQRPLLRGDNAIVLHDLEPSMGWTDCAGLPCLLVRVTHSICDAASLAFKTPAGTIIHSGDFKIDEEPMDDEAFDRDGLRALGDAGVALLLSDSTCASVPGRTRSEKSVIAAIEEQVRAWPGRVIVTQFASNMHRMRGMAAMAERVGRKLCLIGRSFQSYREIAEDAGLASLTPAQEAALVDAEQVKNVPGDKLLVVMTGSQAERRAQMFRASNGTNPFLSITEGDLVLVSARIIPGNEEDIYEMIDALAYRGAKVVMPRPDTPIHTSGHARREELREMIQLLRPDRFIPVHGTFTFMSDHRGIALEENVPETMVCINGEEIELTEGGGLTRIREHELTSYYADNDVVGTGPELRFSDRNKLFHNGVIAAHVAMTSRRPKLEAIIDLQCSGLYTADGALLDDAGDDLKRALATMRADSTEAQIETHAGNTLRRFFRQSTGKKPRVLCFVTEPVGTSTDTGETT